MGVEETGNVLLPILFRRKSFLFKHFFGIALFNARFRPNSKAREKQEKQEIGWSRQFFTAF